MPRLLLCNNVSGRAPQDGELPKAGSCVGTFRWLCRAIWDPALKTLSISYHGHAQEDQNLGSWSTMCPCVAADPRPSSQDGPASDHMGWVAPFHRSVSIRLPDLHLRGSIQLSLSPFKLASQMILPAFLLVNTTQTLCRYNSYQTLDHQHFLQEARSTVRP